MPNFYNKYPYTDFHELNLDWILETVRNVVEEWAATLTEWHNTQEEWQTLYTYVHDYFDNLDVQQEINNKLDAMALDGSLATIAQPFIDAKVAELMPGTVSSQIGPVVASQIGNTVADQIDAVVAAQIDAPVASAVGEWLDDHITQPSTPPIDVSLSVPGAAADAAATGAAVKAVNDTIEFVSDSELFDPAAVTLGMTITNDGNVTADASSFISAFIPVKPGMTYYKNSPAEDSSHRIVYTVFPIQSGWPANNLLVSSANESTAPAGANYAFISGLATEVSTTSFMVSSSSDKLLRSDVNNIYERTDNLVDISASVDGYLDAAGNITTSTAYKTTDFVPVNAGDTVIISPRFRKFLFYYYNKIPNTASFVDANTYDYVYSVTGDGYIRFSYHTGDEPVIRLNKSGSVVPYEPYGWKIKDDVFIKSIFDINTNVNRLFGKSIYSFGDSLMYGHYDAEGILDGLCQDENMIYTKYAVNGAAILSGDIEVQVNNANAAVPDFIVLDGLMNDTANPAAYTSSLGSLSSSFDPADLNTSTFYGAFEHLLYTTRYKYMTSNIIFVCCHKTPSRTKTAQDILQEAVRKCCQKWSIPVLDIYQDGQINCYFDDMRYEYSYDTAGQQHGGNGTHLTGIGYNKWYAPPLKALMLSLI